MASRLLAVLQVNVGENDGAASGEDISVPHVKAKGKALAAQAVAVRGATASKSGFIVAHSFLQGRWSPEALLQDISKRDIPPSTASSGSSSLPADHDGAPRAAPTRLSQLSFRIPQAELEASAAASSSHCGSPRAAYPLSFGYAANDIVDLLYGDSEDR